jgi:threonine dehydrogenase-like Zn-dependent dehydrogenase
MKTNLVRAAFRNGPRVILKSLRIRRLRPGEIRLKITACGICGTDIHSPPDPNGEFKTFGHEIAGIVLETGAGVANVKVGQKVVLDSSTPCGACDNCRDTAQELCRNVQSFFCIGSFGFAEQMIAPGISAVPCDDLDPAIGSLSEPLGVAIDLVRLADIRPQSNVLLVGPGPIGLMALALVRRMGARRVFLSAFRKEKIRVRAARRIGIDGFHDPSEMPLGKADFGCPIDRILVTAPPPVLPETFQLAAKGGIISFIGIGHGEQAYCRFDANAFHFKKLQLRASFASPALFTPMALGYLRDGTVDGRMMISHRFPLKAMQKALKVAGDPARSLKVVVIP